MSHFDCSVSIPPFVIKVNGSAGPRAVGARIRRMIFFEFPIRTGTAPVPLRTTPSMSQNIAGSVVTEFGRLFYFFILLDESSLPIAVFF